MTAESTDNGSRSSQVAGGDSTAGENGTHAGLVPGQPDMWAFVAFETLVFTAYFSVYLFCRAQNPQLYLRSQAELGLTTGVLNTVVLLTSSWSVARCVHAARAGRYSTAMAGAAATIGLGLVFLALKVFEWVRQIQAGNTVASTDFFSHYYFLTSIHCVHLLIGFVAMGVVMYQLYSPARRSQKIVETAATYWHTVDVLWVLIFALLYIVR
ncbi:cytochrome c oxidase subunit 3 [Nocardia sp. BSTN01]|nr:cytochrome c oxidase subunit 3 [Nocardia sp. BSTN01]